MDKLKNFLIEAKKQTYANANIKKSNSSRLNSNDYEYQNENMIYHDTYFDGTLENFIGTETVYKNNTKIFELKCCGGTIK